MANAICPFCGKPTLVGTYQQLGCPKWYFCKNCGVATNYISGFLKPEYEIWPNEPKED